MSLPRKNGNPTNGPRKESETPKPFKLSGKPFQLNAVPPLVLKIKAFLDGQPADEMFLASDIAAALRSSADAVRTAFDRHKEHMAHYSTNLVRPVKRRVFGNPKAITAIKRELGAE